MARTDRPTHSSDAVIARTIHPAILAAIIGLFPFTIYSTFVVPIAEAAGSETATVGALRGSGGIAAVVAGILAAPLLPRLPGHRAAAFSLWLLAAICLIGAIGTLPALIVFCLGIGAVTAVLTPALLGSAAARFDDPGDAGRAATIVTACQSLAAVLSGPVIGLMSRWQGWQGALGITAVLAVGIGVLALRSPVPGPSSEHESDGRPGYLAAFREVAARPQLPALIAIAGLRTASFMGYLAFLAVVYHEVFSIGAGTFTLIWSLSGASFFLGNYLAGRWARRGVGSPRAARAVLLGGLLLALAAVLIVFAAGSLAVALIATVAMGFGHAVVAAQVTTLIAHRARAAATTVFSLNGAAMSVGVFAGAGLGGIGLHLGGLPGIGLALAVPTLIGLVLLPAAVPRVDRVVESAGE